VTEGFEVVVCQWERSHRRRKGPELTAPPVQQLSFAMHLPNSRKAWASVLSQFVQVYIYSSLLQYLNPSSAMDSRYSFLSNLTVVLS
jgi:hypothetical protein